MKNPPCEQCALSTKVHKFQENERLICALNGMSVPFVRDEKGACGPDRKYFEARP